MGRKSHNAAVVHEFLVVGEQVRQGRHGIALESLPHPWNEVAVFLNKYITYEGSTKLSTYLNFPYCLIYAIGIYSMCHFICLKTYITWRGL